jgi:N-methylhydantoinase A
MGYRIGTDIGGTFTDLSIASDGALVGRFKSPSTPGRLSDGVLACVQLAADALGLALEDLLADTETFVHGSTVATNAVLEGKVAKTGLLCTRGTKYTLWRGEGRRNDIFNFTQPPREPLIAPRYCIELDERVNVDGEIINELDDEDVLRAIDILKRAGCEAVAVALLWSIRNSTHERRIEALLQQHWPVAAVSLSCDVQPVLREYTRTSCTVLNVMLKPVVAAYLNELEAALKTKQLRGELLVVSSDGGVQPVSEIVQRPVYMLFSGPSTGPAAARQFASEEGARDALLVDMGGTSFDVSTVIDGEITITRDGRINDYPTGIAAVEILTLGAGGGSLARVDAGGLLQVGPESAGAQPGPACYNRGGTRPTVTDAYVALGYLVPERFLGGRMQLSRDAAVAAITEHVASPLSLDIEAAALGILRVVNERMINGILEMTVRRGIDPRDLMLVTGGGATGVAAIELARELGITRIIVPQETSVLCALGALDADLKWSNVVSLPSTVKNFAADEVNASLASLCASGADFLERLGVDAVRRHYELFASARYPLQVTELDVACPDTRVSEEDLAVIASRFHENYRDRYNISEPENDVELVMWRLVAAGVVEAPRRPRPSLEATDGTIGDTRFFDAVTQSWVQASMVDPDRMAVDEVIGGPALLVAVDTTVVVPTGYSARMATGGYVVIELER